MNLHKIEKYFSIMSPVIFAESGAMRAGGNGVSVFVRTRPTAKFAQDLIEYLPDGQVS